MILQASVGVKLQSAGWRSAGVRHDEGQQHRADQDGVTPFAERLRRKVGSPGFARVPLTVSFGVSSIRCGSNTTAGLIKQADDALYASKRHGRDRVTRWDQLPAPSPGQQ